MLVKKLKNWKNAIVYKILKLLFLLDRECFKKKWQIFLRFDSSNDGDF
jgi:hypothetical protein